MRSTLLLGRLCLRQAPKLRAATQYRVASKRTYGSGNGWSGSHWKAPPRNGRLVLAAAASLSPAAFVSLSEKDNGGTEQTAEGRMLEASRDEIEKRVDDDVHGFRRFKDHIILFLDLYIWEPVCTGLRFLHLVVIFVPVLVTVPALWIGTRQKDRSNERSGTLWWYWFLVKSMERAGPAFIKVNFPLSFNDVADGFSWDNGQLLDPIFSLRRCAKSCHSYTRMHPHIPSNKRRK